MARPRHLLWRSFVSALVALALSCWIYQTSVLYTEFLHLKAIRLFGAVQLVLFSSGTPAASVLALALLWRAGARTESRALALFLALLAYNMSSDALWFWARLHDWAPALRTVVSTVAPAAAIAAMGAFLEFSRLFPAHLSADNLFVGGARSRHERLWRALRGEVLARRTIWLGALAVFGLFVLPVQVIGIVRPTFDHPVLHLSQPLVIGALVAALALGVLNLRSGARMADAAARRRLFWVIEGFLAGTALVLVASAVKLAQMIAGVVTLPWYPPVVSAAFLLILGGLAVAMFYAGALDPGLAIQRTAIFGLVGLAMVFLFSAIENTMQNVVADHLHMSAHLSGLLSGGLVALTFDPVKERCGRLVARWSGRPHAAREVHRSKGRMNAGVRAVGRDHKVPPLHGH